MKKLATLLAAVAVLAAAPAFAADARRADGKALFAGGSGTGKSTRPAAKEAPAKVAPKAAPATKGVKDAKAGASGDPHVSN